MNGGCMQVRTQCEAAPTHLGSEPQAALLRGHGCGWMPFAVLSG